MTGGGQSIGRGIVMALAKEGAQVVAVGRTQAKLEGVADDMPLNYRKRASAGLVRARPGSREAVVRMIPMRRAGHFEQDVGRVAVFLASSDSDFITGHTFLVDGGVTMHA